MVVKLSDRVMLTDEAAESSYGIPVAIIDGRVYGPRDRVGAGGQADLVVQAAAITAKLQGRIGTEAQWEWCGRFWREARQ